MRECPLPGRQICGVSDGFVKDCPTPAQVRTPGQTRGVLTGRVWAILEGGNRGIWLISSERAWRYGDLRAGAGVGAADEVDGVGVYCAATCCGDKGAGEVKACRRAIKTHSRHSFRPSQPHWAIPPSPEPGLSITRRGNAGPYSAPSRSWRSCSGQRSCFIGWVHQRRTSP
jgi:hypothetical protein